MTVNSQYNRFDLRLIDVDNEITNQEIIVVGKLAYLLVFGFIKNINDIRF